MEQSVANNQKNQDDLESFAQDLQEKNKSIRTLNEVILSQETKLKELASNYDENKSQLTESKILTDEDWTKFKTLFERVYPDFFEKLNKMDKNFTKGEKRIMSLIKLNMNNKEAADTLGISSESVSKYKSRLKKKLELSEDQDLQNYIHKV